MSRSVSTPALVLQLARRELRTGFRGFGVFVTCLALGVFAVAAVGSFSAAARAGLQADARSLLGGDLEVRLAYRELTPTQRMYLEARGVLSTIAEMRAMAGRPEPETSKGSDKPARAEGPSRVLVELKGVDAAYPLYGTVALRPAQPLATALALRNGIYGAVVDDVLLTRLGVGVGQRIEVGRGVYEVRAVITAEPDRAVRPFTLGPRVLVGLGSLPATGLLEPGSLVQYSYRLRLEPGPAPEARVEAVTADLERRFPDAGWRVRGFQRAAPRVQYFLDRMRTNLTLVGLCSLLVGGLGVGGAVRGYLRGKLLHLAAMKCVGAPSRLLFGTYLVQILALGSFGAGIGLAAGAAVPYAAAGLWGEALPVPLRPGLFPGPLAVAAAFGLAIALVFSLRPLGAACRVSPSVLFRGYADGGSESRRSAGRGVDLAVVLLAIALAALAVLASGDPRLALWFIGGAAACFLLFRLLTAAVIAAARRAPRVGNPSVRLGIAAVYRPGSMAGSAIFSLGIGLTALVAVALVQGNLAHLVDETVPAEAPSFFFVDIQADQAAAFDRTVRGVRGVTRVERVPTLRGRITRIAGVPVDRAKVDPEVSWAIRGDRFLTYAARPPDPKEIVAGSWWPADYDGPPLLSLTADLARGFGVGVGDTLTVNVLGREITARIANLRQVDWSSLALNFAVILSPGTLAGAPVTNLATVYAPPDREEAVYDAVTRQFPNVSAIRVKEVLQNVSRTLARIGAAFRAMAAVALATGFLVLAGAVSADQHRRIRDAVIFKVCGATRRDILAAFATEFLVLGVAAGAISVLTGSAAGYAVVRGIMDVPFTLRSGTVVFTVLLGLGLTLALGLLGTARALARKPAPYLRNE